MIICKLYFPSADSTNSLLLSVGTFAAGFFTRPLGTGFIAIAPTYAQIGVAAPVVVSVPRSIAPSAPHRARRASSTYRSDQHTDAPLFSS